MGHLVWLASNPQTGPRLADHWEKSVVDDVFSSALRKQTGVSLKYM